MEIKAADTEIQGEDFPGIWADFPVEFKEQSAWDWPEATPHKAKLFDENWTDLQVARRTGPRPSPAQGVIFIFGGVFPQAG